MSGSGEELRETIRPEFNPAIMIDFQGAKITSDTLFSVKWSVPLSDSRASTPELARLRHDYAVTENEGVK